MNRFDFVGRLTLLALSLAYLGIVVMALWLLFGSCP